MLISTKRTSRKVMNKSYSYLLPLFNEECPINGDFFILLKNVYTKYNDKEGYLVLCYENTDNDPFSEYLGRLHDHKLFVESYVDEDNLVYLVFNFPESYKYEYNCYRQGKFSKFRESAKLLIVAYILNVHKSASAESVRKVLYKDKALKESMESMLGIALSEDTELSSVPVGTMENCYNFEKINNE